MNKNTELIIINGENKTNDIAEYYFVGNKCNVRFTNGSRIYPYNRSSVKILPCKGSIDITANKIIAKGSTLDNICSALDFGEYIKIGFSNGSFYTYKSNDIQIKRYCTADPDSKNIVDYFTELADGISLKTDSGIPILSKQFAEIRNVEENSVLGKFLREESITQNTESHSLKIYPFGLNPSQKTATMNAFSSSVSVVEGPPGTGKTQTILNIIANIIMQDKKVAVVSGNNSATANVLEKLDKNGFGFICASLGSKENKDKFIEQQNGTYPDMTDWQLAQEEIDKIEASVKTLTKELDKMLKVQNEIAILHQELSALEQEKKHFDDYFLNKFQSAKIKKALIKLSAERVLQLWLECEKFEEENKKPSLWFRLKCSFLYGIESFKFYNRPIYEVITIFQDLYYGISKGLLENRIVELKKQLQDYSFKEQMQQLTEKSMLLFKARLASKYDFKKARKVFTDQDLWQNANAVATEYPVVLSTTYSIRTSLSKSGYIFDYIIVDEASQVDLLTGVLSLASGHNVVIVGDLKQLPNVATDENKIFASSINEKYKVKECFDFCENSLLSSIVTALPNAPRKMLREHYRCHPKIIEFCNNKFYDNQLIVMTEDKGEQDVLGVCFTKTGNHARGCVNQRQIDVIKEEILPTLNVSLDTVGIVTPYRDQANRISDKASENGIEADTVHKYQGREKENIIISTVDNKIGKFADNPNMLNVAVSRAIKRLRVVISDDEHNENTNTGDLVKYIKYNSPLVEHSDIYSIFDLLYKAYDKERRVFLSRHERVSLYDSENLMHSLITKVLVEEQYKNLDFIMHQPLRQIIRNTSKLTEEEKRYALHENTHVDFMIFNKMDKMPVLAIEVDGVAYHKEGSRQSERDKMKNDIFKKYNIKLLRFSTDGSKEKEELIDTLKELTKKPFISC